MDAYNGRVDHYVFEPDDPLVRAYQAIFPGLFKSREEMPEHLRAHVRVPLDLFTVQTQMMLQYHTRDPVVFYNKEDQWDVPVQTAFGRSTPLRPYYIVARLPGEEGEEFLLIQPFTPNDRHNLVGWMAARSDGEHYGELLLFRFPTGRHVDGPNQIEARIDNDAVISEQFTLWVRRQRRRGRTPSWWRRCGKGSRRRSRGFASCSSDWSGALPETAGFGPKSAAAQPLSGHAAGQGPSAPAPALLISLPEPTPTLPVPQVFP